MYHFCIYEFDSANVSGIGEIVEEFKEELINIEVITPKLLVIQEKYIKTLEKNFIKKKICKSQDDVKELFYYKFKRYFRKFSINEANDLYFPALI